MIRLLLLVTLAATLASACASHEVDLSIQAPATFAVEPDGYEDARVTDVVDGDTIEVEIIGRSEGPGSGQTQVGGTYTVRLVGIDTPESVDPRSPVECFGREASTALGALLDGKTVRMVKDLENVDRYERLLRYIYMGEEMANARMVVNGYAHAYTYPPNVRHSDLFVELERQAREENRGLWSSGTCSGRG